MSESRSYEVDEVRKRMSNINWSVSRMCISGGVLCVAILLASCRKEFYANLSEQDANEVVAALLEQGIDATKDRAADGKMWSVEVGQSEFARAMEVLHDKGLPHRRYESLGDLFRKDGFISTPTEERVRFLYGVEQELSDTLTKIDGVILARVQIVLPNNDPLAQAIKPSTAAVFIKYRVGAEIRPRIPQIKTLVMHSVEGLSYDAVSVIAVPADSPSSIPSVVLSEHILGPKELLGGLFFILIVTLLCFSRRMMSGGIAAFNMRFHVGVIFVKYFNKLKEVPSAVWRSLIDWIYEIFRGLWRRPPSA